MGRDSGEKVGERIKLTSHKQRFPCKCTPCSVLLVSGRHKIGNPPFAAKRVGLPFVVKDSEWETVERNG